MQMSDLVWSHEWHLRISPRPAKFVIKESFTTQYVSEKPPTTKATCMQKEHVAMSEFLSSIDHSVRAHTQYVKGL